MTLPWLSSRFDQAAAHVGAVAAPSGSVWGDHGTNVLLSTTTLANDTATGLDNSFSSVRGTRAHSTGKHYFEIKVLEFPAVPNFTVGVMDATTANGAAMDDRNLPNSQGHNAFNGNHGGNGSEYSGTDLGTGFTLANNDVLGIAMDQDNGFYYLHLNNVYFLGGVPTSGASGTGAAGNGPMSGARPMLSLWGGNPGYSGTHQLITTNAAFIYAKPSGYSEWG